MFTYTLRIVILFFIGTICTQSFAQSTYRWLVKPVFQDVLARNMMPSEEKSIVSIHKIPGTSLLAVESEGVSETDALEKLENVFPYYQIEPDHAYSLNIEPNDPHFQQQQNLNSSGENGFANHADIKALEAWDIISSGGQKTIAIIDGGIDLDHEDLRDNLWTNLREIAGNKIDDDDNGYIDDVHGWDFVNDRDTIVNGKTLKVGGHRPEDDTYNSHGTHVAGVIGAKGNNGKGVTGVCWDCKLLPLKFADERGRGYTAEAIEAVRYAIDLRQRADIRAFENDGADIIAINSSWGGGNYNQSLLNAIREADSANIFFVAAAGNDNQNNNDRNPFYPASYAVSNIISVGAIDSRGEVADFSNYGPFSVDIMAPGEAIRSTINDNKYGILSGTSMAAPHVSGALALLAAYRPEVGRHQTLKSSIINHVTSSSKLNGKCYAGGSLNLLEILKSRPIGNMKSSEQGSLASLAINRNKDAIWAGIKGGLIRFSHLISPENLNTADVDTFLNAEFSEKMLRNIVVDADDNIWASVDSNLYVFFPAFEQWLEINTQNLPEQHIGKIAVSENGVIGVEVGNYHVGRLEDREWTFLDLNDYLPPRYRNGQLIKKSMTFDLNGNMYLNLDAYVIENYAIDNDTLAQENLPEKAWFYSNLMIKWDGTQVTTIDFFTEEISDNDFRLVRKNINGDEAIEHPNILAPDYPYFHGANFPFLVDTKERIWASELKKTNDFYRFDGRDWESIDASYLGGIGGFINSMAEAPDGSIWVSGSNWGSLARFDGQNWNFFSHDRFNSEITQDMIFDKDGNVWMTFFALGDTEYQLAKFVPHSLASFVLDGYHTICRGEQLNFTNTSVRSENFEWYINDEKVSVNRDFNWTFNEAGEYKIMLKAFAEDNRTHAAFNQVITVTVPAILDLGPDTATLARVLRLEPNIPPMARYSWRNVDNMTQELSNLPQYSVVESNTYVLRIQDFCGFESTDSIYVSVNSDDIYVLPGEVNGDGEVNMIDILLMGVASGRNGSRRPNASTEYVPQQATPWERGFSAQGLGKNSDYVHADADGDGRIDINLDAEIVRAHANSTHKGKYEDGADLAFSMEIANQLADMGDMIDLKFFLEGDPNLLSQVYGIAISVNLNVNMTNPPMLPRNRTFLGTPDSNVYQTVIFDRVNKRMDFGFTRIDQQTGNTNNSSYALVGGGCTITIIEDIDTTRIRSSHIPITYTVDQVVLVDKEGKEISLSSVSSQRTETIMLRIPPETSLVSWTNVDASCHNGGTLIEWDTWGKNIIYYELQRSVNGGNFETVQRFSSQSDTTAMRESYSSSDFPDETTKYRIKALGRDKEIHYSEVVEIGGCHITSIEDGLGESKNHIYPNPAKDVLQLAIEMKHPSDLSIEIFNLNGQMVSQTRQKLVAGRNKTSLNVADLSKGVYYLQVHDGEKFLMQEKFVVVD